MSNTNLPFGFKPLGLYSDVQPSFGLRTAKIASTETTPIYRGDPIVRLATGYVHQWSASVDVGLLVGIFWGAKYASTALGRTTQNTFWPGNDASADATCYYIPIQGSPAPLFVVQVDSGPAVFADIGCNFNPVIGTGAIKGTYGLSGATLGYSTKATTATLEFRLVGLWSDYMPSGTPGTDDTAAYNLAVVQGNSFASVGITT